MRSSLTTIFALVLLFVSHIAYGQQDSVAMSINVEQVTITGDKRVFSTADRYGNITLNTKQLFSMPRVAGAVDIVRMLQYSPGVVVAKDGDTSLYVRGSDAGQNLTLLNNAPVYSPAHLFGFFSVFNSAHISGATFIKSSMPAKYGSALSSILDIRTNSYVPQKFGIEGNIGLIESDLAAQIPLGKKSAIYVSARHSYISWLVEAISRIDMSIKYEFSDYGLTYVQELGKAGKLVINSHYNQDSALADLNLYDSKANVNWWDSTSSAVLTTSLGKEVTMENTLYATIFKNGFKVNLIGNDFSVPAGICDFGAKHHTQWRRDKLEVGGGVEYAHRRIQPQSIYSTLASQSSGNTLQITHEAALFASALYKPWRHLELDLGIRLSMYAIGRKTLFNYEPRLLVAVPFGNSGRMWAAFNKTVQYLQLVPQSNAGFATDFYMGSTNEHPPQESYSSSLGYSQSAFNSQLRWSVELFYRQMYNVVEFDARLNTMLSTQYDINDYLYSGIGEAYGAEFMLSYSHPKFDIQAHYTLSRSIRQFRELNRGKPFAASSDRPHNLSLYASYKPIRQLDFSATFVYATGGAYTAPTAIHMSGGGFLKEYGAYNAARLPDYHRLDLSVTYWFKCKRLQRNGINISVYNVYMRRNPILLSWHIAEDKAKDNTYHILEASPALFEILPSISWNFKF